MNQQPYYPQPQPPMMPPAQPQPQQQPQSRQTMPEMQQPPHNLPPNLPMGAVPLQTQPLQTQMLAGEAAQKSRKKLTDKIHSANFSTIVKALCLLIVLAAFLPFGTVSCGPMVNVSVSGYDLALGNAAEDAAALSQGNMGMGMGMGAGQLAALNMMAGVNLLLLIAFVGTALLFVLSLFMGRTRAELAFALIISAFSLATYLQWLGIFSAFTGMFARASEMGGEMISAGPDLGLYAVVAFSTLLLIAALLEAVGKLPTFETKGDPAPVQVATAPAAAPAAHIVPVATQQTAAVTADYVAAGQVPVQPVPVQPVVPTQPAVSVQQAVPESFEQAPQPLRDL
ncbi:MAG: hypothetical protein FWE46_04425 [Coriobacteriia bacterium]|nr:hypothetical protein [Coriobacteriia bacterium]MCL2537099.1 hypothetical protein [Coriobacteriia bacterium]